MIRKRIADGFHLEMVITSHDSERVNFSENTDLSELLFIARRRGPKEKPGPTLYINLWRNPRSIHEALDHATRIAAETAQARAKPGRTGIIKNSSGILGEYASLPAPKDTENWTGAIFAQSYLMQAHWALDVNHEVRLPGEKQGYSVSLCRLDELGTLGYDVRDITDAFDVDRTAATWSPYAGFYDHDANKVRRIAQKPNATLLARTTPLAGRKLKDAGAVWSKAGKILLVSRLRSNTHRVIATGHPKKVLGNTWWGFDDSALNDNQRKALLLWLNSTLGIMAYYGRRAITQGAWMQMKKPAWASMPVLNVQTMTAAKLTALAKAYDELARNDLLPIAKLDADPVRKKIDAAIVKVCGLPGLDPIRELLAREPGLSARDITHGGEDEEAELEEVEA